VKRRSGTRRVIEHNLLVFRRTWRGTVFVTFIAPVLFLAAMGIGLGSFVNRNSGGVEGVPYRDFLAPGLLAATAMQTAMVQMSYPIMAKVKWLHIYEGMLATPLRVGDLLMGETIWMALQLALVCTIYFAVIVLFGAVRSSQAPIAIAAGILTGLAFAVPIMAYTATQSRDSGFAVLNRFIVIPLFLFGGTFFPVSRLPLVLQVVAWATPLAHGVALARSATLGTLNMSSALVHVLIPCAYAALGIMAASMTLRQKLVV